MSGGSAGNTAYQLAFQISPIILIGGIATFVGALPIVAITQSVDFLTGLLSGSVNDDLDSYFAQFQPMSGGTLIENKVGTYPFANQQIAANAIISQPLSISIMMTVPARGDSGVWSKVATMTALQASLSQHNSLGGTYVVATPSYFYANCIMTGMRDISGGETKQAQYRWQLDFTQPLITANQLAQVQSQLMSAITNGGQTSGALTGVLGSPNNLSALFQPGLSQVAGGGISPSITSSPSASIFGVGD